jgi:D-glycero-alpha-D-manno-heptose-7-phosphate kinase
MRISFGGGGTEIDPYREDQGGKVMNATIARYAHASIEENDNDLLIIKSSENGTSFTTSVSELTKIDLHQIPKECVLAIAALRYFLDTLSCRYLSGLTFRTFSDAPVGSGLGASSTMTVAIVHALLEYFKISSDPYYLATVAHEIERDFLSLAGGIQDHFCAAFGGFNFMEFGPKEHVLINPLRIKRENLLELESSLMLLYTGTSRESAQIIEDQILRMQDQSKSSRTFLDQMVINAEQIKAALLKWNLLEFGKLLNKGWELKKKMSKAISNSSIDSLVELSLQLGAKGVKLCGAGGGGYLLILVRPEDRAELIEGLSKKTDDVVQITFVDHGSEAWSSQLN